MAKFRKKPVVIEAVQWKGDNLAEIIKHMGDPILGEGLMYNGQQATLIIPTLEGNHTAIVSDWIIKGVKGEFYPCKNDIFEQTYERVE